MKMTIGVIGMGSMGRGIAQVASLAGHQVMAYDTAAGQINDASAFLEKMINRMAEKGKLSTQEAENTLNRLHYSASLESMAECGLVIEAIVENVDIKLKVFTQLESIVDEMAIIATNTSSLSVSALASCLKHQQRFVGLHFFNPAALMKLVEVVPALQTDPELVSQCTSLMKEWGKVPVLAKDTPGFIVNRIARPFYGEALRIFDEGMASPATVDHAMKTLGGFKMGPFELMDFIGNDVNYTVTATVYEAFYYDPRYKPSFTQKRLADAGWLGRKTGRGYYNYSESMPQPEGDEQLLEAIYRRILCMLINEAADALFWQVASKQDIELAMTLGVNYPKGLLALADEWGIDNVTDKIDALYDIYHEDRYRCSPLLRRMCAENETFF